MYHIHLKYTLICSRGENIRPIHTLGDIDEIIVKNEDLPDPILYPGEGVLNDSDDSIFSSPLYRLSQKQELQRL